jgi:hypothetical protein
VGAESHSAVGKQQALHGGRKIAAPAATAVRTGDAQSKTNLGSVTVALGQAQFGAQSFFQLFKLCLNL